MSNPMDGNPDSPQVDWATWIRGLGRHVRRLREFLGLSQEQIAKMAGVSQGAVSRLEGGRGLATPLLVVMKINAALRRAVSTIDPELLSDDARRLLTKDPRATPDMGQGSFEAYPILKEPALEELIALYRELPDRHRAKLLAVVRATTSALLGADAPEPEVDRSRTGAGRSGGG
jgi:transcriptional regulator with XRE-family HTH domain